MIFKMNPFLLRLLTLVIAFCFVELVSANEAMKPNVLIFFADDLGFSDIGCYGGEIETPNLNRLAENGLRFTQCYNTARCWPSRAALLTGYYAQAVRRDTLPGMGGGGQGVRPKWAKLLPQYLHPLGYRSYHSGKWHVDGERLAGGFDHSYSLEDHNRLFSPQVHLEDDVKLPAVGHDSNYYGTTFIADHAIKCLKEHSEKYTQQPFFQYVAFTSPHFPLHARGEDVAKYRGRYRQGWDALRIKRLERMRSAGIINCDLSPRTPDVPAWDTLSESEKDAWDTRMAIHAAMVDRMDREIGKVLDQVKKMGALDTTFICFMSDNGASAERILRGDGHNPNAPPGSAQTFQCLEPGWANLANTPLRLSKIFVHEGGISTPLIVHWPAGIKAQGELRSTPCHLIDFVPTILELVGAKPTQSLDGKTGPPLHGKSIAPLFAREGTVRRDYLWWFHSGNRAIRLGDWKLVATGEAGNWELYDLSNDRAESHDLAAKHPEKVRQLEQEWTKHLEEFRELAKNDGNQLTSDPRM